MRLVLLFLVLAAASCSRTGESAGIPLPGPPTIAVSIPPQAYFVERIAGDKVRVLVLAGPGQNPHNYETSPQQMALLAGASCWILSGAEFEIGLRPRVEALLPRLTIVDGTAGIRWRTLEEHDDGDDDGEIHKGGIDRHSWLGREPALILAEHIRNVCVAADQSNETFYRANCEALSHDINAEFEKLREALAPLKGRTVFVYHPAFGYFLDEFGIIQRAVETGGKEPTPRGLYQLIEDARREKAAAIFVQAQFPAAAARTAAQAIGAEIIPLDPLFPDWLDNIRAMSEALKKAAPDPQERTP